MKRILLTLLGIVLVIGVLAGIGYAGYQIGFRQGARIASNGDSTPFVGRPDSNSERPAFPLDRVLSAALIAVFRVAAFG